MRICLCIDKLSSGGAEKVISTLANEFGNMGQDVFLIETSTTKWDSFYSINPTIKHIFLLDHLKKHVNNTFYKMMNLRAIFKKIRPDVIISFKYQTNINVFFACLFLKIPHIVSERNDPYRYDIGALGKFLKKIVFRHSSGAVFQTEEAKRYYFKRKDKIPTCIIDNPIFLTFCSTHRVFEREKTVLYVGRLDHQKNVGLLIDAFNIVHKEYRDFVLKIYGAGPLESMLKERVNNLECKNNIVFLGTSKTWHMDEHASSVFVMPSNYEGMPNALMEAMALGIPCISTDCPIGGPRKLIKNGYNGILVPPNDVQSLSDAMLDLISNKEKQTLFSHNNANMVIDYSSKKIASKWNEFIEGIIER